MRPLKLKSVSLLLISHFEPSSRSPRRFIPPMRALTLHISALNDSEYDSYTDALNDLTADANAGPATDEYYEKISVGVREVRAWLRGRYSTLPVGDVDAVCFRPALVVI